MSFLSGDHTSHRYHRKLCRNTKGPCCIGLTPNYELCHPYRHAEWAKGPTANEGVFAFPATWTFVIGVSGAIAEKTGDKMNDYNDAALLAREAGRVACEHAKAALNIPHLANVVQHFKSDPDAIRAVRYAFSDQPLYSMMPFWFPRLLA
jgi:hypothetical protein